MKTKMVKYKSKVECRRKIRKFHERRITARGESK